MESRNSVNVLGAICKCMVMNAVGWFIPTGRYLTPADETVHVQKIGNLSFRKLSPVREAAPFTTIGRSIPGAMRKE